MYQFRRSMLFCGWKRREKRKIIEKFFNHLMRIHDTGSHVKVNFLYFISIIHACYVTRMYYESWTNMRPAAVSEEERLLHFCLYLFRSAIMSTRYVLELFTSWYLRIPLFWGGM
jgi:hypothetical protein